MTRCGQQGAAISRRRILQAAAIGIPALARTGMSNAQDKLAGSGEVVVFSYGGSWTDGVRRAIYEPFTRETGIKVVNVVADYCEPQLKAMQTAGRMDWDVAYPDARNFPQLQATGMFLPIDYSLWDKESIEGTPERTRLKDAFVVGQTSQVLIYDERVFKDKGPRTWRDFWDAKKFPGARGLIGTVQGQSNIVFALVADGMAPKDVWPLTDDKIDRALKKLSEIKPQILKWWTAGGEPVQLMTNREYVISSCYNNRAIVGIQKGLPVRMSYDGAYHSYTYGAVLKGGPNTANAHKYVAYINRAKNAAAWTQNIGWPGSNVNQLKYLPPDLVPLLSINPQNFAKVVVEDSNWLAAKRADGKTNIDHVHDRWQAWRTS